MKKTRIKHFWIVLGAYGIWFAILSGLQEVSSGKYWKAILALVLGTITWWWIEFGRK